jgi:hypothetical protein
MRRSRDADFIAKWRSAEGEWKPWKLGCPIRWS